MIFLFTLYHQQQFSLRSVVFLIHSILATSPCFGQTLFGKEHEITSGFAPMTVHAADMDGDGDLDVLSASQSDDKIAWYENLDGKGSFGWQRVISDQADGAITVNAADFDGDGDIDVVSASLSDAKIAWYENVDGKGQFSDEQIVSLEALGARFVFPADLDQDGDVDILSCSQYDHKIAWYENLDGQGSFGVQQVISLELESPTSMHAADMDGDGDMDVLASAYGDYKIAWFENMDGFGTFGDQHIISEDITLPSVGAAKPADVDHDGDLDVIYASTFKVGWFENENGTGGFGQEKTISLDILGGNSIAAADIDQDGFIDIVSASSSDAKIAWYKNLDGLGTFSDQIAISNQAGGAEFVILDDLNADGNSDVIVAAREDNKIVWYKNENGMGSFGDEQIILQKDVEYPIDIFRMADVDQDNDMDIIGLTDSPRKLVWLENEFGLGTFTEPKVISNVLSSESFINLVDLDKDGDEDILTSSFAEDAIYWYENTDGKGNFGPQQTIATLVDGVIQVSTADLDGDGDLDVLAAASAASKILWFENVDGQGSFSMPLNVATNTGKAEYVYAADLDGDGDQDVVAMQITGDDLVWYENTDGLGTMWSKKIAANNTGGFRSFIPTDLDGDGDQDLVSEIHSYGAEEKIIWYENEDGQGNFSTEYKIAEEENIIGRVYLADLDADGDTDILSNSQAEHRLAWYENEDGQGNFGVRHEIPYHANVTNVQVSDCDGDGDLDVLFSGPTTSDLAWIENLLNNPALTGTCFYDINQNKQKDADEVGLLNHSVHVEPNALASFTNAVGIFKFAVENGTYTLAIQPDAEWQLTTDSASYTVSIQDTIIQDLNFGLIPVQNIIQVVPTITGAATRCGFQVPFWINYENTGTNFSSGYVSLQIDPLTTLINAVPAPDSIEGNLLFWKYDNLPPSYNNKIGLMLQMPSVVFLGETVSFTASTFVNDSDGIPQLNSIDEYQSVINCAYDPNDKLVQPQGIQDEQYTLFGQELEYTVRFQNTGTDTAFTVRIEDQLDADLDWATFRPVAASHQYEATLHDNGMVEFLFKNILLPDSTINEPASHGFVKYRIRPLENLAENTEIQQYRRHLLRFQSAHPNKCNFEHTRI